MVLNLQHKAKIEFVEKINAYLVISSHFRSLSIRESACVNVFWLVSDNRLQG